jgi:anti-anti-sigma regulatory factor
MDNTTELLETRIGALREELALVRRELAEREQELGCFHAAFDLARPDDTAPLDELFQRMVELVPLAFLDGESICARVGVEDQSFVTPGFRATSSGHTQAISVEGTEVGTLEVYCLDEPAAGAPFSKHKQRFLANLADRLGEVLRRRLAADQQRQHARERDVHNHELQEKLHIVEEQIHLIHAQARALGELSAPVLEVWDQVLVVPIIGVIDEKRGAEITETVLAAVVEKQARFVLLDLTGMDVVDTSMADRLLRVLRATSLLGATCMLTGIRPSVAHFLVDLDVNMGIVQTHRALRDGLRECLRRMHEI